jgi:hypothetical protein
MSLRSQITAHHTAITARDDLFDPATLTARDGSTQTVTVDIAVGEDLRRPSGSVLTTDTARILLPAGTGYRRGDTIEATDGPHVGVVWIIDGEEARDEVGTLVRCRRRNDRLATAAGA